MTLRLKTLLASLLALLTTLLLAIASAGAKPASGGYQLFERAASGISANIQLASLGNFDYQAKVASECCNAPKRGLTSSYGSVTCGQHACGMVLNTQGKPVAVDDIIRTYGPDMPKGSTPIQLQRALRDNGVGSTYEPNATVSNLASYTSNGRPAIATVRTGPDTYHAIVVDGVTTRSGQQVVAIRDPAGGTNGGLYYETVSSFISRFTGGVIRINKK